MSKLIDKLAFIYTKDQKILVTLSKGKDKWYIPGGKREQGESDEQTLIREVQEELDVQLKPETIKPYGVFQAHAHGKDEDIIVQMTCYTAEFSGELKPMSEIDQIAFFEMKDVDKTSDVDHLIFADLKEKGLIK